MSDVTEEQLIEWLQSRYKAFKAPPAAPPGYFTIKQLGVLMGLSEKAVKAWIDEQGDLFEPYETTSKNGRALFYYRPKM